MRKNDHLKHIRMKMLTGGELSLKEVVEVTKTWHRLPVEALADLKKQIRLDRELPIDEMMDRICVLLDQGMTLKEIKARFAGLGINWDRVAEYDSEERGIVY